MKFFLKGSIVIVILVSFMTACHNEESFAPSDNSDNYEPYNEVVISYFESLIERDYNEMKKYLPDKEIQGDSHLANATEKDMPERTDVLQEMGDKYSVVGFDYFYESHNEIYYSIEYYNSRSGHERQPLVIGIKKTDDGFCVINKYGINNIPLLHLKDIDGDFTPLGMKEILNKYPDNTFVVKEYPEE